METEDKNIRNYKIPKVPLHTKPERLSRFTNKLSNKISALRSEPLKNREGSQMVDGEGCLSGEGGD